MINVQSPVIPVVGQLIRDHPGTISLGQGVVHYGPPPEAIERMQRFFDDPQKHKYQPVEGIAELHDAITHKLRDENGIELGDDQRIFVTAGANMGFMNAIYAVTDPGDEVIFQRPYYFNHDMAITMANAAPVAVDMTDEYQLDVDAIAAAVTERTRAIVTISPNNPTGAVYSEASLRAVNDLCRERGLYHICDEPYEYFVYDGASHFSPGAARGSAAHTISLYSLSKGFGFASWRIGFMVIPEHLFIAIKKAQDTMLICPPVICQEAAVGALEVGRAYAKPFVDEMAETRHLVLDKLAKLGDRITVPPTQGAFYFLLRLPIDRDPMHVVEMLVRDHRVAVIPGTTFGIEDHCDLRISYGALEKQTVAEGIGRLVTGLKAILG